MDVPFFMSKFRLYPGLFMSIAQNSVRKNLFLGARFCGNSGLSIREMDQKFNFVGTIGYGDSYLEFFIRHFKVSRLHAILHDAVGAEQQHSGKAPGYCYMIGWGPNSCLLGQRTRLLFRLYLKLFLPSIFISVDFWSSISGILLVIELPDKNVNREKGVFIDGKFQGYSFRPPKKNKPTIKAFWCTRNLDRIVCRSWRIDYSDLSNNLRRAVKGEYSAKRTENCKILGNLLEKKWKTSKITAVSK